MREKKRFENTLDECVAAGLNAGTQVLMNQVRGCILSFFSNFTGSLGGAHHLDTDQTAGILST